MKKNTLEEENKILQDKTLFIESLINNTPIPIFYKDINGIYLGTNEEFDKLLAIEKGEFIGKSVYDIAPKEIADKYHEEDLELFENPEKPQVYEFVVKNRNGNLYDVIFYKKAYLDSLGNVKGLIGAILDVTKRKKDEEKIKTLFESFDKNIIASRTDLRGIITYASEAFSNISGYSQNELIGQNHNILKHPDMSKEVFKDMWKTIKSGKTWKGEIKNKKKDGSFYWIEATISPYYEKGKHVGYSSIRVDISSKKELEKLNTTLEKKVKERTENLKNKLFYDDLTGLKSNYSLLKEIEKSDKVFTSLMLINIDNFQKINSIYGFEVGNKVLKEFAKELKKLENKYKVFRIYADEFALLKTFNFLNIGEHHNDLTRLKNKILDFKFYIEELDEYIKIDVTAGVAFSQEDLMSTSEMALRYAKKHKLGFKVYNNTLDQRHMFQKSIEWKDKIDNAITDDRVIPVFQAIVNRNEEIIKYEVLMRIVSEEDGDKLISSSLFLEEAVNLKLYSKLAISVIEKTFIAMKNSDKMFSINLSFDDIFNKTIIDFLETKLKKYPSCAKRIVIEILETQEISDLSIMNDFLSKMRNYGVKIAIDDFGVGHSNFAQVLQINPDYIKIDGEFVKEIDKNKQSFALVRSLVTFAKELDIKVIAEFVHSKEVFEVLYFLGVDEFQGFYFSSAKKEI